LHDLGVHNDIETEEEEVLALLRSDSGKCVRFFMNMILKSLIRLLLSVHATLELIFTFYFIIYRM